MADTVCLKVLEVLQRQPRLSFTGLARQLNMSPHTVKSRLDQLEREGIFRVTELRARLDPAIFDLHNHHLYLKLDREVSPTHLLAQMIDIQEVDAMTMLEDGELKIDLVGPANMDTPQRIVDRLKPHYWSQWQTDPPKTRSHLLTSLDTRILRQLRRGARVRDHQLAKEIGVTLKTVRHRVAAMEAGEVFMVQPAKLFPGRGIQHFLLTYTGVQDKGEMADHLNYLGPHWQWWHYPAVESGRVLLSSRNQFELEKRLEEAPGEPKVQQVEWHRQLDQWVDPLLTRF